MTFCWKRSFKERGCIGIKSRVWKSDKLEWKCQIPYILFFTKIKEQTGIEFWNQKIVLLLNEINIKSGKTISKGQKNVKQLIINIDFR